MFPGNEINWDETPELMKLPASHYFIVVMPQPDGALDEDQLLGTIKDGDHAYRLIQMLMSLPSMMQVVIPICLTTSSFPD